MYFREYYLLILQMYPSITHTCTLKVFNPWNIGPFFPYFIEVLSDSLAESI